MERPFEPGVSWLGFYGGEEGAPVRELYGVFRRQGNDADRRAGEHAARSWSGLDWSGKVAAAEGRLLLAGLGGELDMVYAAPVGDDRVATAVLPNGGGGCGRPGPDGLIMIRHQTEARALVFHGLVADSVESVVLIVAGEAHEARLGENAFGLWLDDTHEADEEAIVLRRRDGMTNTIGLSPQEP